ncbi:MAG: Rod shape-determining protein RodA [uncultured bacterium]|nr:MAG: Rod shape-determining protein RodA [uncultured bacterium]OGH13034.1 MAG: hypothetical protein A2687_04150 [Candidatus Levybacteria bacterium RIFCSPHIGHO2_01_FULL_38_26]
MKKSFFFGIDWGMILPAIVLVSLGLTAIFSINPDLFRSQLLFFILAIIFFLIFSQVNYKILENNSRAIYVISIILLILILIVGVESRGAVRWFEFFGLRIQFSEIVKPFFAVALSSFLLRKENSSLTHFILSIIFVVPLAILIFLQPDLGNAIIYVVVTFFTMIFFGFPIRYFLGSFLLFVASLPFFWNFLHQYQKQRVFSFINPTDTLGISYNAIQSSIAVGSGMLFGRGFGEGTQSVLKFLPERHTDFIYAALAESLGFVGAGVVVLCFGILLYRIYIVSIRVDDQFCRVFCAASFFLILSQFFINTAMNMGFLPIVGIALPFVSYGGSSLLSNFVLLGLLSSISRSGISPRVLEIK